MTEQKTVAPPIPVSGWIEAGIYVCSIGVLGSSRRRPPDRRTPDCVHPLRHGRVGADAAGCHRPGPKRGIILAPQSCWSASPRSASRSAIS
jgi:hypothetical protein